MNLNFDDLYQIEGGSSQKKIYRFKNNKEKKIVVDFSYESKQFELFLDVYNFLSKIFIFEGKFFNKSLCSNISVILMTSSGFDSNIIDFSSTEKFLIIKFLFLEYFFNSKTLL